MTMGRLKCFVVAAVIGGLIAVPNASQAEPSKVPGEIRVLVAYARDDVLTLFSLEAADYHSMYELTYLETPHHRDDGGRGLRVELIEIPSAWGRMIVSSLDGLGLSWADDQYWMQDPMAEVLPGHLLSVGLIEFGEKRVLGCPVSPNASGRNSEEANRAAWLVQLLHRTRERERAQVSRPAPAKVKALLERIREWVPEDHGVRCFRGQGSKRMVPVGEMLQAAIARAIELAAASTSK